jgi:hypothetical protein
LELTALRRPFLYFPLEKHFEQHLVAAERVARIGPANACATPDDTRTAGRRDRRADRQRSGLARNP